MQLAMRRECKSLNDNPQQEGKSTHARTVAKKVMVCISIPTHKDILVMVREENPGGKFPHPGLGRLLNNNLSKKSNIRSLVVCLKQQFHHCQKMLEKE